MKGFLKLILKQLKVYHPLQSSYRGTINFFRNKKYQIKYARYKGKGFICNVCGCMYEKFVPEYPGVNIADAINKHDVIAGFGENVFCPNCMSKNRERLLIAALQDIKKIENKTVLLFSPEKHLYHFLKRTAIVTTVDIEPEFYRPIDPLIQYADATRLQFAAESFDVVIANHVLEHIPEDLAAMKELHRVLKKGGFAILQVPFSLNLPTTIEDPNIKNAALQERLFGQNDHVRIYSLNDYLTRLEKAGFTMELINTERLEQFAIHAIQDRECIVIGHK